MQAKRTTTAVTAPDTLRRRAIREERCLVRVRHAATGRQRTLAVCPGCWHSPHRRAQLLQAIHKKQLDLVTRHDGLAGVFLPAARHAARCLYRDQYDFSTPSRKK